MLLIGNSIELKKKKFQSPKNKNDAEEHQNCIRHSIQRKALKKSS